MNTKTPIVPILFIFIIFSTKTAFTQNDTFWTGAIKANSFSIGTDIILLNNPSFQKKIFKINNEYESTVLSFIPTLRFNNIYRYGINIIAEKNDISFGFILGDRFTLIDLGNWWDLLGGINFSINTDFKKSIIIFNPECGIRNAKRFNLLIGAYIPINNYGFDNLNSIYPILSFEYKIRNRIQCFDGIMIINKAKPVKK
jgi:hypothetical protein